MACMATKATFATLATIASSLPLVGLFYACQRAPAATGSSAKLTKLERFGKFRHVVGLALWQVPCWHYQL